MLPRLRQMGRVPVLLQQRQQRLDCRPDVAHDGKIDRRPATDVLSPDVDLGNAHARPLRIELPIGKIGAQHQQDIAIEHRVIAGGEPNQPGHADVVGVVPLNVLLAAHGMDHRRFETLRQCQKLGVRALTSRTAQYGDAALAIQQRRQPLEVLLRRGDHRRRRQQSRDLGHRRIGCGLQGNVAGQYQYRYAALRHGFADRNLQRARHLIGAGDKFAIMAALFKQGLRVRFLKIAGADFGRRNLRGDGQHRHARPVAIEQPVDQVQIARPAAPGADREFPRQMRLGACRECANLLVPDMDPLDLGLAPDRVGQSIQTVADNAVDPLDTGCREGFRKLISNSFCHVSLL
jgi:hypothetical protein